MNTKMEYRPDIDGLRAIAVLAVIFYHIGIKIFSGGFVGVDVFFVISGFLITSQIVKEIQANEFSIISFYERRIRRIFPAFFTVTVFILIVGAWLFDPTTYREIGKSAVAAALSLSNIFFWSLSGYFDSPSALKPFLHAWSLSVEEQFYLVLPILLFLLIRYFKSWLVPSLAFLIMISLGLDIYILSTDPNSAFFLAHLRAWELLFGSLIAIKPLKLKPWLQNILSVIGMFMILISTVLYSGETLFPGIAAGIPVLGSALIINSGVYGKSIVGKILSIRPLVFIGKISYSLYLWHWPLLVFWKYYLIREITNTDIAILLVTTLLISILSWKFIEIPFRSKKFLPKPGIFVFAGSVMALIIILGFSIDLNRGFPSRFQKVSLPGISKWNSEWDKWEKCVTQPPKSLQLIFCPIGKKSRAQEFLLWGDSHATALAAAVNRSASKAKIAGVFTRRNACAPLIGIERQRDKNLCIDYNNAVLDYIKANPEIKTIILVARWPYYADGSRYKTEEGASFELVDVMAPGSENTTASIFEVGLYRTINELIKLNRNVIIVSAIPEIGYDVPSAYSIALRTGRDVNEIIGPTLLEYQERNSIVLPVFEKIKKDYKIVRLVDLTDLLCNEKKCSVVLENKPLYRDDDHLSTFGAYYVSRKFDPVFAAIHTK